MNIEIGKCDGCAFLCCHKFDPSPHGVALSSGSMEDCECSKLEELGELLDDFGEGDDQIGSVVECPLWQLPAMEYCVKHKTWNIKGICDACMNDDMAEVYLREEEVDG